MVNNTHHEYFNIQYQGCRFKPITTNTTTDPSRTTTSRMETVYTMMEVTDFQTEIATEISEYEDDSSNTTDTTDTTEDTKKKGFPNVIFPIVIFGVIFLLLILVIALTYLIVAVMRTKMGLASTYNLTAGAAASADTNGHKNPAFDDGEIAGDMTQNGGLRQIKIEMNKEDTLTPL
ncbi:uncharacterized protein [Amphiura filiformis]|uniref:uncharacterized protein n=1 Tax=Amphiura filiformis TaxID=82378 RepID=UPI003B21B427